MEGSYSKQQRDLGIMVEEAEANLLDSISSASSSQGFSIASSESDFTEKVTSSPSSSSSEELANADPLYDMSPLLQHLPRRGLSKYYHGKSRSFASFADVRCIKDLALPENRYVKRLKSCKSNGGLSETHKSCPPNILSEKASNGSHSSLSAKKSGSFLGNKPPIPPHRST